MIHASLAASGSNSLANQSAHSRGNSGASTSHSFGSPASFVKNGMWVLLANCCDLANYREPTHNGSCTGIGFEDAA